MLDAGYIIDLEHKARRFSGAWTGTSGTLAAGIIHLLNERATMQEQITTLEESIAKMRAAVNERMAGTPADDPKMQGYVPQESCCDGGKCHAQQDETPQEIPANWILRGQKELQAHNDDIRFAGDSILADRGDSSPAEDLLHQTIGVIRDRRPKYGGPLQHFRRTVGMINAAFSDILQRPLTESDWAQFMLLDKIARYNGPNKTADGPVDLAGYAACLAECEAAIRPAE